MKSYPFINDEPSTIDPIVWVLHNNNKYHLDIETEYIQLEDTFKIWFREYPYDYVLVTPRVQRQGFVVVMEKVLLELSNKVSKYMEIL